MSTTQQVLELLTHTNDPLSGQDIANQLGLSRTAVWKAIKSLQTAGYKIDSRPRVGYQLYDSGNLSEALIRKYLPTTFLYPIEIHKTIDSTNIRAKQLGNQANIATPYIVIADQQTAGYGRYGRNFVSPSGTGIYISILLNNSRFDFDPGLLTTAVSLAITRTIEKKLNATAQIKWVNDVIVDEKKICGILTEGISDLETQSLTKIVVGAGINYLTTTFPIEIEKRAGSLRKYALQAHVSRNEFIANYLIEFFNLYKNYFDGTFMDEYRQHSNIIGHKVTISQGEKTLTGTVTAINDKGALVLADGTILSSGEVTKIRPL
ncbi:biotin--[acetyl-CoA-carboxylase] ligase [Ligilactobacillus sp. WILCCON 0076]|uniref:Bifunctional ligase/repressor BirA n=1 Tax=Ligilactobacillus ubinensis TaxID=2876789 RepID=A0A9X2FL90_9LACO|nr:biotin--[acetyl-CoA-carboxylase] ligase [Ligilactobacillus ubinensis]MCP0887289.1 biotin--[acetyl-CoA-carboxylase] ligase [Ligilactobacillus ubinensis]